MVLFTTKSSKPFSMRHLLLIALLPGCSLITQNTDWKPAIDHMNDPHPGTIAKDERECKILTTAYVNDHLGEIPTITSIYAVPFIIFGSDKEYKQIFKACVTARGHKSLN